MPFLFSYGTIQQEHIQQQLYGRKLKGSRDILAGYKIIFVENRDPVSLAKGEEKIHRLAISSHHQLDYIEGTAYEVSDEELRLTDRYEPDGYKRIKVTLESGKQAWVYTKA